MRGGYRQGAGRKQGFVAVISIDGEMGGSAKRSLVAVARAAARP